MARRDADSSSSIFGVVSAPLYSLALTLPAFIRPLYIQKKKAAILYFLFLIPALEVLFLGSRGLAITTLTMLLIYLSTNHGINIKKLAYISLASIFLFVASSIIFLTRIDSYGLSPLYSAYNSGYAFTLIPSEIATKLISSSNEATSLLFFSITNLTQYYLHGLLEFFYLIEHFDGHSHQLGGYTFKLIYKLLGVEQTGNLAPREGVYTTLYGPLWIDFGFVSIAVAFALGKIFTTTYRKAKEGNYLYIPAYGYMASVVFFSPVVNLIQNALGLYVATACIILVLSSHLKTLLSRISKKIT